MKWEFQCNRKEQARVSDEKGIGVLWLIRKVRLGQIEFITELILFAPFTNSNLDIITFGLNANLRRHDHHNNNVGGYYL